MKRLAYVALAPFLFAGLCSATAERQLSDVEGWDVSACVAGVETCWQLYTDNESKFDNGFVEGLESIPGVTP